MAQFYGRFSFSRYCYPDLSEIHVVHPFDDKSFVKFIIHTDSFFSIQSSRINVYQFDYALCKKVSDIWQFYITVTTAAGVARAVQNPKFSKISTKKKNSQ